MSNVAILTPAYGGLIHVQNAQSVTTALFHLQDRGWNVGWIHYGNVASVTKARNAMVCEALTQGFDNLVFIDSDIAFAPETLERLLSHDYDLVAGAQKTNTSGTTGASRFPYALEVLDNKLLMNEDGIAEVAAVSTAFMRLRAPAVREFMLEHPHLKYADDQVIGWEENLYALFEHRLRPHPRLEGHQKYNGEDYSFCYLWRESGRSVMVDLQLPLRHIKTVNLDGAPITALTKEAPSDG